MELVVLHQCDTEAIVNVAQQNASLVRGSSSNNGRKSSRGGKQDAALLRNLADTIFLGGKELHKRGRIITTTTTTVVVLL